MRESLAVVGCVGLFMCLMFAVCAQSRGTNDNTTTRHDCGGGVEAAGSCPSCGMHFVVLQPSLFTESRLAR